MKSLRTIRDLSLFVALSGSAAFALAEDKPKDPGAHHCAMEGMADMQLATFTVENTSDGASIRLKAKVPKDAKAVQELAKRMAEHMQSGCTHCVHDHHPKGGHKGGHGGHH